MVPTAGGALVTLGGRVMETALDPPVLLGWPLASIRQILSSALSTTSDLPYTFPCLPWTNALP